MPKLIIIAGPNGAGKTSFVSEYHSTAAENFIFINADEIARKIAYLNLRPAALDIRAGRGVMRR